MRKKLTHTSFRMCLCECACVCVCMVSQCAKFNVPKAAHKQSASTVSQPLPRPFSRSPIRPFVSQSVGRGAVSTGDATRRW